MAYNYLGLVNDVNKRLNEVELIKRDSPSVVDTFSNAIGEYAMVKDAINVAIRQINQYEFSYPFNSSVNSSTLTPGVTRYTIPTNTKHIDYKTSRIKKDTTLNTSGNNLSTMTYYEYIAQAYASQEDEIQSTTLNGAIFATTASGSSSSTSLTVASNTSISVGNTIVGTGIPDATTVTGVSGTTITISAALTETISSVIVTSGSIITLTSSTGFSATGTLFIGGEQISYTGITSNNFTGCIRGANSTTAATHASGTVVTQFDNGGVPRHIVRTPDNNYLLYPFPDKQYTLVFDFFTLPTDLVAATEVPSLPEQFRTVIVEGAMYTAYMFRGETQEATIMKNNFEEGIKNMRTLYINKYDYISSTLINKSATTSMTNSRIN